MSDPNEDPIVIALFSELFATEQKVRQQLSRALPYNMELSHFMVLNYLSNTMKERSPVQLARTFNLTKGAMTNTLSKLETAGYIHIRPDWDDARKKMVSISDAGERARDEAILSIMPIFDDVMAEMETDDFKDGLRFMRRLRLALN
ncbi:MAG: MarR family transcriptional regulator [Pseudomonadota bacterium]